MKPLNRPYRRGYAAVIAMVMLVIGTALATGFASMLRAAQDIGGNQIAVVEAKRAAESGMNFLIYKMIKVAPGAGMRSRTSSRWIPPLATALQNELNSSVNLGAGRVQISADQLCITIPPILLNGTECFTATITPSDTAVDNGLTLRVTGSSRQGAVTRTLAINLNCDPERLLSALRFAIASKGTIDVFGASKIYGYDPVTGLPDGRTGQVVSIGTDPTTDAQVIVLLKSGEALPDYSDVVRLMFPNTDASFVAALPEMHPWDGKAPLTNVVIPPGTGGTTTFTDQVINGIMYVKWPNNIVFSGTTRLNGVIVYEGPTGTVTTSSIELAKNGSFINSRSNSLQQLALIPSLTDEQRKMLSSWAIIAPNTDLTFHNGDTGSGTNYFENSVHVKTLTGQGQGGGLVSLTMNQASVLCEGDVTLGGNRVLWMRPADDGGPDGNDYLVQSLYVMQTTYREPR